MAAFVCVACLDCVTLVSFCVLDRLYMTKYSTCLGLKFILPTFSPSFHRLSSSAPPSNVKMEKWIVGRKWKDHGCTEVSLFSVNFTDASSLSHSHLPSPKEALTKIVGNTYIHLSRHPPFSFSLSLSEISRGKSLWAFPFQNHCYIFPIFTVCAR